MPDSGVHIHYGRNLGGRPQCWALYLVREATEEDLEENHLLEEIGESIWSVHHEISFCPHCGMKLTPPASLNSEEVHNQDSDKPYGGFSMFDQQQWHGKLR